MLKYNAEEIPYKVVLASASPRRMEMFQNRGLTPQILPSEVEENLPWELSMEQTVMYLALKKARDVAGRLAAAAEQTEPAERRLVVAADTVVYKDGIIGKPADTEDAVRILEALRGKQHFVATGVAIMEAGTGRQRVFCQVSKVWFKDYSRQEILDYAATGEPLDKAGGYAIQGGWGPYVDRYEGDYDNIIGFPWERFLEELAVMDR